MQSNSPEPNKSKKTLTPEAEFSKTLTFRDYLIATEQKANQPLPFWRLLVPLLIQAGIIMAVPSQAFYTDIAGKTVILQSSPANPEDVVQNYSLNLDYNISRPERLKKLPGWEQLLQQNRGRNRQLAEGTNLYVILQEQQTFSRGVPKAWRPVRLTSQRPINLSTNQVALKGVYRDGSIAYGVETYYIPEQQRERIAQDISRDLESRNGERQPIVVKVKVDPQGNAVPISLWVRDRNYRF